jgi:hypothetical protein
VTPFIVDFSNKELRNFVLFITTAGITVGWLNFSPRRAPRQKAREQGKE